MLTNAAVASAVPADARCSLHPDRAATAACARCGAFVCGEDRQNVGGSLYCPTCAARPEIDYLEAFRQKHWGKRDGWAWLMGFGSVVSTIIGLGSLVNGFMTESGMALFLGGILLAQAGVQGSYFFGLQWARWAVFAVPAVSIAFQMSQNPAAAAGPFVGMALLASAYFNTRNRLFFRVEVTREALRKAWDLYANNTLARTGFILSLLFGMLAPISLVLSIIGLTRVNPNAHPPIGRKGQAIAGIVISSVSIAAWGAIAVVMLLR